MTARTRSSHPLAGRQCALTGLGLVLASTALGLGACGSPATTSSAPAAPARSTAAPAGSVPTPGVGAPSRTAAGARAPGAPVSRAQAAAGAQAAVDRLFAAGAAGDRRTWDAGISAPDPAFAERSALLFDNLRVLRPARLRVRLTGTEQEPSASRRAQLGPGARVLQARIAWRLRGERADASASVWLTLVPGPDGVRLAGTDDGAALDTPAAPLWWLARVSVLTRGNVTVLVGPGQDVRRWARLASRAAADARAGLPRVLSRAWDGHLVVLVPGSATDLARVLGGAPSAYATTAAVTRPDGPTTSAALRVVVNPATAPESDAELGTTLTHETVHVVTRSAASAAPLWAVEGLAEEVALEAHPDQRADEVAALRTAARPARLPDDAAFTAGGPGVTAAYAQAWLVWRAVAEHRSRTDLGRFYAALDAGRPVEAAARSTLGVDDAEVVRWWREALRRPADDGRG